MKEFQSSFELTGYITKTRTCLKDLCMFQSSFELTGYITNRSIQIRNSGVDVSKLFRAYRLYNSMLRQKIENSVFCFKALSSLRVI